MKALYKLLLAIALVVVVILILKHFVVIPWLEIAYIEEHRQMLMAYRDEHYIFSMVIFMLIYCGIMITLLPITMILNIVAGYFYGIAVGTALIVISFSLGSLLNFLFFKLVIKKYIKRHYYTQIKKFNDKFNRYGAWYLFSLQLFPVLPFAIINAVAAFSEIKILTFLGVTALGIIPSTIVYTYVGQKLVSFDHLSSAMTTPLIGMIVLMFLVALVPFFVRYMYAKR